VVRLAFVKLLSLMVAVLRSTSSLLISDVVHAQELFEQAGGIPITRAATCILNVMARMGVARLPCHDEVHAALTSLTETSTEPLLSLQLFLYILNHFKAQHERTQQPASRGLASNAGAARRRSSEDAGPTLVATLLHLQGENGAPSNGVESVLQEFGLLSEEDVTKLHLVALKPPTTVSLNGSVELPASMPSQERTIAESLLEEDDACFGQSAASAALFFQLGARDPNFCGELRSVRDHYLGEAGCHEMRLSAEAVKL
jgi:hypothetical protein